MDLGISLLTKKQPKLVQIGIIQILLAVQLKLGNQKYLKIVHFITLKIQKLLIISAEFVQAQLTETRLLVNMKLKRTVLFSMVLDQEVLPQYLIMQIN